MIVRIRSALLLAGLCASSSFAQTAEQPPAKDFTTMKAQITARLQQELACVEAAATQEALMACRPHPPGGHPPGPPPQEK